MATTKKTKAPAKAPVKTVSKSKKAKSFKTHLYLRYEDLHSALEPAALSSLDGILQRMYIVNESKVQKRPFGIVALDLKGNLLTIAMTIASTKDGFNRKGHPIRKETAVIVNGRSQIRKEIVGYEGGLQNTYERLDGAAAVTAELKDGRLYFDNGAISFESLIAEMGLAKHVGRYAKNYHFDYKAHENTMCRLVHDMIYRRTGKLLATHIEFGDIEKLG